MKKIKIFIVTYNDNTALDKNIQSFFDSKNLDSIDFKIFIINNFDCISMPMSVPEKYETNITIMNNVMRPDFSKGHLSRNWNQSIIQGFRDLNNPECDIVITCQDDTLWDNNWIEDLLEIHKNYTFYTCDWGDGLCSYTPDAIKKIGLWDERFCGITYQEADYFLRALVFNKNYSSINDKQHGRINNPEKIIAVRQGDKTLRQHNGRHEYLDYTLKLFKFKWNNLNPENWNVIDIESMHHFNHQLFKLYPYFEKDIDNKNFIL